MHSVPRLPHRAGGDIRAAMDPRTDGGVRPSVPAALLGFARSDPLLAAVFAFPLAWNSNVENGFLSYAAGVAFLFFALHAFDRFGDHPRPATCILASLAGTLLYFFHILPWLTWLLVAGATGLISPRPW